MANNSSTFTLGIKTKVDSAELNRLKQQLREIQLMASDVDFTTGMNPTQIQHMTTAARQLDAALTAAFDVELNTLNIQKFNDYLKRTGTDLQQIQKGLYNAGAVGQASFAKATAELFKFNTAAKQTNVFLDKMADTMANTVRWGVTSSIFNNIVGSVQKAYYYIEDLDTSINDIQIVTEKSADEMARFAEQANNAAKALATTTTDYTQGALIYYQQGLDDETVKTLTDITAKTSNVTGQSMQSVSEQLTAVWNGYQVANEAAAEGMGVYQEYVDKMAAVGAATASDLEELATAMSKVASAANAMGVDFDQLSAQIATIVSVTRQAPESVGTALKTIYARIGDLKMDGVDEFGITLGEVSGQLEQVGIQIMDQSGNMRDVGMVMEEVAAKWGTWNEAQQQSIAIAIAGKRQYNNLLALFENWDMYTDTLNTAANAAGTLDKQQSIALESLENKLEKLSATAEDLYDSLFDEESLKDLVDGITPLVQGFADMADAIGGLNNLLPMLGSIGMQVFGKKLTEGLSTFRHNLMLSIESTKTQDQAIQFLADKYKTLNFADSTGKVNENQKIVLEQMVDFAQKMLEKRKYMNEEDEAFYNRILDEKAVLASHLALLEQIKQKRDEETSFGITNAFGKDVDIKTIEKYNSAVVSLENNIARVTNSNMEIIDEGDSKNIDFARQSLYDFVQQLYNMKASQNSLIKAKQKIEEFGKAAEKEGKVTKESLESIIKYFKEFGIVADSATKVETSLEGVKSRLLEMEDAAKNNIKFKEMVDTFSRTAGAIGQFTSSLTTLANLDDIINNEELEAGEKIFQIISNLSFALPSLIMAWRTLNSTIGITSFLMPVLSGATAAYSAATTGAITVTQGFHIALDTLKTAAINNPLAPLVLAVSALIAVVTIAIKVYDEFTVTVEEADEALAESVSNYEKITNELTEVENKLADVTSRLKELKALEESDSSLVNPQDLQNLSLEQQLLEAEVQLLREKAELEQKEKHTKAVESANAKITSKYSTTEYEMYNYAYGGNVTQTIGNQVTREEELDFAIEKYKEIKNDIINNGDSYSKQTLDNKKKELDEIQAYANSLAIEINTYAKEMDKASQEYADAANVILKYTDWSKKNTVLGQETVQSGNVPLVKDINLLNSALEKLYKNEQLITEEIQKLEQEYKELNDIQNKNSKEYIQALHEAREAQEALILEEKLEKRKNAQEALNNSLNSYTAILNHAPADFLNSELGEQTVNKSIKEVSDALEEVFEQDYQLQLSLQDDIVTDVDNIVNAIDSIANAVEKIGEGFLVASEDAEALFRVFPELALEAEVLSDGTIQLNHETVQTIIDQNGQISKEAILAKINEAKQQSLIRQEELKKQIKDVDTLAIEELKANATLQTEEEKKATNSENLNDAVAQSADENSKTAAENEAKRYKELARIAKQYARIKALSFFGIASSEEVDTSLGSSKDVGTEKTTSAVQMQEGMTEEEFRAKLKENYNEALKNEENFYANLVVQESRLYGAGKGTKKGSKEDKRELKEYMDEFDRYWTINKAIEKVTESLSDLDKVQSHLFGKELIANLQQQNALLDEQANKYRTLFSMQQQEAVELQRALRGFGVAFDAAGGISNYAAVTQTMLSAYNTEAISEEGYEQFKKLLERYEELFYSEMVEVQNQLDDIYYDQLANNLEAWEIEIELNLELKEAEREWSDFIKEVKDDFNMQYRDIGKDFINIFKNLDSYNKTNGTIATDIKALKDAEAELARLQSGLLSTIFASASEAEEKIKELKQTLMDDLKSVHDLWADAWDAYMEGIDQAASKFDDLMGKFETIDEELEYQGELIELLYGSQAYELMNSLYDAQIQNSLGQIDSLKQQAKMWKELYDNAEEGSEEQTKYYENWQEAQSNLNNLVIEHINLLKNDYNNTLDDVLNKLEKDMTGGFGLDDMRENWEDAVAAAEKYYDTTERIYELESLESKFQEAINNTSGLENQQKLKKLMDDQLTDLKAKEKLTEYDITLAEKRLSIAQAEMALEDARNAKNSMKLVRGANGNWEYQYVADESDVAEKQKQLLESYHDLYQYVKDTQQDSIESILNITEQFFTKMNEIRNDDSLNEEQKMIKMEELREQYYGENGKITILQQEHAQYTNDLNQANAELLWGLYDEDEARYEEMTEAQKVLIDSLKEKGINDYIELRDTVVNSYEEMKNALENATTESLETWSTAAAEMANAWNADDGESVKSQILAAFEQMNTATDNYLGLLKELETISGESFGEDGLVGDIQAAIEATQSLSEITVELCDETVSALEEYRSAINDIEKAWLDAYDAAMKALGSDKEQEKAESVTNKPNTDTKPAAPSTSPAGEAGGNGKIDVGDVATYSGRYHYTSYGGEPSGSRYAGVAKGVVVDKVTSNPYGVHIHSADGKYGDLGWIKPSQLSGYDTGGYTGEWLDGSGKLAMLHSKELVLNADDTENILEIVKLTRDMASLTSSVGSAVMNGVKMMLYDLMGMKAPGNNMVMTPQTADGSNVFNITAEFPNANDVTSIREAILSLPNMASQYLSQNKK